MYTHEHSVKKRWKEMNTTTISMTWRSASVHVQPRTLELAKRGLFANANGVRNYVVIDNAQVVGLKDQYLAAWGSDPRRGSIMQTTPRPAHSSHRRFFHSCDSVDAFGSTRRYYRLKLFLLSASMVLYDSCFDSWSQFWIDVTET